MIGEPTLDPALGEKRRKALQAALARAAGQQQQQGVANYGAVGRGSVSGFGIKPISRGGRPSSILNFLSQRGPQGFAHGQAAFQAASGGLGRLINDVQMPTPLPAPQAVTPAGGGDTGLSAGGSTFGVPTYSGDGSQTGTTQLPVSPTGQWIGDVGAVDPSGVDAMSFSSALPGSGMIPLGGGIFLDPETGMLHGSGM